MTTPTVAAIETEYAGHRFRSRLEARWAVFFDAMGIDWVYEPQGYHLGNGDKYLPDFWLPGAFNSCWVEVKGAPTEADWIKLHAATAADGLPLSLEDGRRPCDVIEPHELSAMVQQIPRVLLLGDIPDSGVMAGHHVTVLTAGGPATQTVRWGIPMPFQLTGRIFPWGSSPRFRWHMLEEAQDKTLMAIDDAFDAARQARFEHGESGRPRRLANADFARLSAQSLSTRTDSKEQDR